MPNLQERLASALAGRYAVERRVGGGGVADVFRARDLTHGRSVALKLMRPDIGAAIGREHFLREIKTAARLHHPHILPLYDSGEAAGLLYYVMPYLEEETLRGRLDRTGRLRLPDVLRITTQLADALDFAHQHGVIHRDVKPENVLLLADHALIADVGVAWVASPAGSEHLTGTGMMIGTPTYMSPEQVFGDRMLDGRSDQYSLACIVFEMLGGTPPFGDGIAHSSMARLPLERAPVLVTGEVLVPEAVSEALHRALAKQPGDRFPTVKAFAEALVATGPAATPLVSRSRSLVVLPFANLSDEADTEFLSEGVTEELIHTLSTLNGLRIVGGTSAFAFKGTVEDVRTIGTRLGVELALEGSVRRSGQRLRITAQLTDVNDGVQLWSERFERTLGDALAIQDEIAAALLTTLRLTFLGRPPARPAGRAATPRAYELYLRGRHCWSSRTEAGLSKSLVYLREAIAIDPDFAAAPAALAEAYVSLGAYGAGSPELAMPLAEEAARDALKSDSRLAEAHGALASVQALHHWRWLDAEVSYRRAISANPSAASVRQSYAVNLLLPRARWDEAQAELERARALEPLAPVISLSLGLVPFFQRDYETAIRAWRDVLATDAHFVPAHYFTGQALALLGRHEEAVLALDRAAQISGESPEISAALGWVVALAGRRDEALERLANLGLQGERRYVSPVLAAQILAALGEMETAIAALTRAVEIRAADAVWLGIRPAFDGLREDPRFQTLVTRIGAGSWLPVSDHDRSS